MKTTYLIPKLKKHPTFSKFVDFYSLLILKLYNEALKEEIVLLDCLPGSISPKVQQAVLEAGEHGVKYRGNKITGIDVDPDVNGCLGRYMKASPVKFNGVTSKIEAIPFESNKFNLITLNHPIDDVLYYLVQKQRPDLYVDYKIDKTGCLLLKQALVFDEILKIINKDIDFFVEETKKILLEETTRVLKPGGYMVILNYFTDNWKVYDPYLHNGFSNRIYTLTRRVFNSVAESFSELEKEDITSFVSLNDIFAPWEKVDCLFYRKK